jgi:hypothetical protein
MVVAILAVMLAVGAFFGFVLIMLAYWCVWACVSLTVWTIKKIGSAL